MKKQLSIMLITGLLCLPISSPLTAMGAENGNSAEQLVARNADNQVVTAGVTPDSVLYGVDELLEGIQEYLASNSEGKAKVLMAQAAERVAEAIKMKEKGKDEFVEKSLNKYTEKLDEVNDLVALEDEDDQNGKEKDKDSNSNKGKENNGNNKNDNNKNEENDNDENNETDKNDVTAKLHDGLLKIQVNNIVTLMGLVDKLEAKDNDNEANDNAADRIKANAIRSLEKRINKLGDLSEDQEIELRSFLIDNELDNLVDLDELLTETNTELGHGNNNGSEDPSNNGKGQGKGLIKKQGTTDTVEEDEDIDSDTETTQGNNGLQKGKDQAQKQEQSSKVNPKSKS